MAHVTQQTTGSAMGKNISKVGDTKWELNSNKLFRHEGQRVSRMTHGDDFVVTEPTSWLPISGAELQGQQKASRY